MSDRAPRKGLVVIHLDGLSHGRLGAALEGGHMPFAIQLFEVSGDKIVGYHNFLDTSLFAFFGLPEHLDD